jgi:hypothetical protein
MTHDTLQPHQDTAICNGGGVYNIMDQVAKHLTKYEVPTAKRDLTAVVKAKHFIVDNTPPLTAETIENSYGFYSPAHMMACAITYVEQCLTNPDIYFAPGLLPTAIAAADQAKRLMSYPDHDITKRIIHSLHATKPEETFNVPCLIEIPDDWRNSQNGGIAFENTRKDFILRRKANTPISQDDIDLLGQMSSTISKAYEGHTFSKEELEKYPDAVTLIQINIALIKGEARKFLGRQMPLSVENAYSLKLITGLLRYNQEHEIQQQLELQRQLDPKTYKSWFEVTKVIKTPAILIT